jgi:hypothetical protein
MRSHALPVLALLRTTTPAPMLSLQSSSASSSCRAHIAAAASSAPCGLLLWPPTAAARRQRRPEAPPATYFDAGALHRERLAFQRRRQQQQQQQQRQQEQQRGLSSFPADSGSSSTTSLDDSAAATSAAASPQSVRPGARHHKARHYARLVRAWKRGRLGFGFSAGGLLFPYYAGTIAQLREMGVMPPPPPPPPPLEGASFAAAAASAASATPNNNTLLAPPRGPPHLAGASAGALIAAVANAGVPLHIVEEACVELAADCLRHGTPGRLGPGLRALLEAHLPPDAHLRCRGNTHVAVTRVMPVWRPQIVSDFRSREDLIEALMASAHIPVYLDGRWATRFRGSLVIDGGATTFIPLPPLRSRRLRRGAARRRGAGGGAEADGGGGSGGELDPDETEHEEEQEQEEQGEEDAEGQESGDRPQQQPRRQEQDEPTGAVDAVVKICCFPTWHLSSLSTAAASVETPLGLSALSEALRTDVSPDAFEPFPYDLATVAKWALAASPRETFDFLLARGRRDAALFARESGLEEAALEARWEREKREAAAAGRAGPPIGRPLPLPLPPPPVTPPVAAAVKEASSSFLRGS